MDEVKRKVLWTLFASPTAALPVVCGAAALLLSWGFGGSLPLRVAGVAGVVGGVGLILYRLTFGLEKLTRNVFFSIQQRQQQEKEAELDALEARLRGDRDPRTQTYLRHLRELYRDFQEDIQQRSVPPSARTVLGDVENLFRAAIKHLEQSYHLWETAGRMSGDARQAMLAAREQIVQEVQTSVEHVSKTIEQFHSFRVQESETELARLRHELDETMQAARRVEERVEALGKSSRYDISEFE